MTTNRISRHGWLLAVAGLIIASLVFTLTPGSPAQAPKTKDKAKDKDKTAAKKEPKIEPPPATFPKRIDFIDPAQGGTQHVNLIDEQITKFWKENKTYPSERCTDYEFIRRASLDIVGRIPTVEEIAKFMKQPEGKRRSWVINAMLDGPEYGEGREYAQNFANIYTVLLMTHSGSGKHYQAQMNDWLYSQFKGDSKANADWSKTAHALIASEGETNREAPVNYLLHNLGDDIKQNTAKNGKWDMVPATSRTTRLFLGVRLQCVQCHDHPFNGEWGQHHFWGINAFLRQVDTNGRPTMLGKKKKGVVGAQEYNVKDNPGFNTKGLVPYERRNAVVMMTDPSYLNNKKIAKDFKGTRREALANFITADPFFAKAFVNRMWGHFFGISFIRGVVDDFHEQNPVSHPELLEQLSKDFANDYKHNPKVLIRWICNSQAYGLSSRANKWNDKTDDESLLFARMLLKPMTPEQMFESMMVATQSRLNQDKEKKLEAKEKWFEKLIVNFGNDEGEEGSYSGTVIQALLLMNGQDINSAISDPKDGIVASIVAKRGASYATLPAAVNDMYLHALGRPPTDKELKSMRSPDVFNFRPGTKTQPNTPQFWTNYYQDVIWACLANSNEFILNH